MRQSFGDIVLAEGNNELNVQLVPIAIPGAVIEVTPDAYGVGQIWDESPGSGCSLENVELNGVRLTFNPSTGKYELFTVPQGQSCTIRVTAGAWLTPKTGYWPSYGRAWGGVLITAPDGTQKALGGAIHNISGHYEANKDTFTETCTWVADQIGIYEVIAYVRCVPYW